jgi:hypothetical protein
VLVNGVRLGTGGSSVVTNGDGGGEFDEVEDVGSRKLRGWIRGGKG